MELSRRCAFASVVDNRYLIGFKVLLSSLLKHNTWFEHDFVIFHYDLTPEQQAELHAIYDHIHFRLINPEDYKVADSHLSRTQARLRDAFYKFEIFTLDEYDRVVLLDTDMIILGDVSFFLGIDTELAGRPGIDAPGINTGLLIVGRKYLNRAVRDTLIAGIEQHVGLRADQDVFSAIYGGQASHLPERFNCIPKRVGPHAVPLDDVVVLHYAGPNPWDKLNPSELDHIWIDFYCDQFGPLPPAQPGISANDHTAARASSGNKPRRTVKTFMPPLASRLVRGLNSYGGKAVRFTRLAYSDTGRAKHKLAAKLGLTPPSGVEAPSLLPAPSHGGPWLSHIASYNPNAGDVLLPVALRDLFAHVIGPIRWHGVQAHPVVTDRVVADMNRTRGVVIGGGGLFLKDTNANANSGWQWNCPIPALRSIKGPLALFAVGYNRFRGQPDFDPIFSEQLALVADKAVFIGLRNSGSIRAVRQYLPAELQAKLRYQPCMTTLMTKLYPHLILPERSAPPFVALNCAFDRSALRFGDRKEAILRRIAEAMHRIQATIPIRYYAHMALDDEVLPFLDERGVKYEYVSLQGADPAEIVRAYSRPALTIGMRGHAQMIPFGCGRPVLSLISHDKLRWFLEDIDATEWGLEVDDDDLADRLPAVAIEMIERAGDVEKQFDAARDRLWDISMRNVADLARAFGIAKGDLGPIPTTPAPAEVSGDRSPAVTPTHGGF